MVSEVVNVSPRHLGEFLVCHHWQDVMQEMGAVLSKRGILCWPVVLASMLDGLKPYVGSIGHRECGGGGFVRRRPEGNCVSSSGKRLDMAHAIHLVFIDPRFFGLAVKCCPFPFEYRHSILYRPATSTSA